MTTVPFDFISRGRDFPHPSRVSRLETHYRSTACPATNVPIRETVLTIACKFPEVESIAGAPGVLPTPFAAMHGLPSPLAGPYNGVPPAGGLAGLGGFPLGAAGLGVRVPTNAQTSAVLLVSNLNEEVSDLRSAVDGIRSRDVVEDMEIREQARRQIEAGSGN